jgi:hypothetical protein
MDMENQLPPPPVESEGEKDLSFGAKLMAVVMEPRKLFQAVAIHPAPMAPIIVLIVVTLGFAILTRPLILQQIASRDQIEKLAEKRNMSEAEVEKALEVQKGFMNYGILLSAPLFELITLLFFAAVLMFVGNALMGGTASFTAVLAGYAWARMINVLGLIIKTPLALTTHDIRVTLSPAIFLSANASDSLLFSVLSVFDIFHIWEAILVCFAMAAVYKMGLTKAVSFVGALYIVLAGVGIILKQVFSVGM